MDRRHFLSMLGLGAVGLTLPGVAQADILKQAAANPNIKPISGSWNFSIREVKKEYIGTKT